MKLFSPAKLNLFFKVLQKRTDGYHEIASIFVAISLGDRLHITLTTNDTISCNDPTIPLGEDNLIMKAIHLFRKRSHLSFHAAVNLDKQIPPEAGLGGGSSNAATTLWGLNKLLDTPFTQTQLIELAAELGSDVPFFFSKGCAHCTGRGEKLEPLTPFPFPSITVAKSPESLSTPLVYKHTQLDTLPPRDIPRILQSFQQGAPIFFNDLERAAFQIHPQMATYKNNLQALGFNHVVMTGSGSAFFCLGDVPSPSLQDVTFYPAHLLSRVPGRWWKL